MTIGTLTADLGLNASIAMKEMTSFQKMMITVVANIDSTLARMEASMGKVGAASMAMSKMTVKGFQNIAVAATAVFPPKHGQYLASRRTTATATTPSILYVFMLNHLVLGIVVYRSPA